MSKGVLPTKIVAIDVRSEAKQRFTNQTQQAGDYSEFGDCSTSYQPKRRECDPKGKCSHGFERHKPCIPCDRLGDANCAKCFDVGAVRAKQKNEHGFRPIIQCSCVTNPKDRAR